MTAATTKDNNSTTAIIFAVFAVACVVAFLAFRGSDVGQLLKLVGNLGGGPLAGNGSVDTLVGLLAGVCVVASWAGLGALIVRVVPTLSEVDRSLMLAIRVAVGAGAWSLVWFGLGLAGLYTGVAGIVCVLVGLLLFFGLRGWQAKVAVPEGRLEVSLRVFAAVAMVLAIFSAIAPPIAKDALLYHYALPDAFVSQHSNAFVDGNLASFLALGTEMHNVWAMLVANIFSLRAGETAVGVVGFFFFPLLLTAVARWAIELGVPKAWSMTAVAMVAAIPTAYYVASSGYIDLSLALYVTLATYALTRWWNEQTWGWAVLIGIFLGAALSVKMTAVFVFAAFSLIVLLRARGTKNPVATAPGSDTRVTSSPGRIVLTGFGALLLAGVIASPWYVRTWVATGSPVFPFYMNIWPGKANGWDVERSNLFQAMNSQYGGVDTDKVNYLTAPVRASIMAQPEQPANYDGVLGVAFLIGLPLLGYALWKLDVAVEIKIMAGVAGVMYLFWLFSSEQLRYLLPIVPMLAIAIVAAAEKIGGRVAKFAQCSLIAASVCGLLTTFAWFCQKAPLRVVLGGETRDQYLTRNLDYYPFYQSINSETAADARIWLINMRRDTYNIERPVVSDYLFEDWTLRDMLWHSRTVEELRAKAATLNVQYVLARHDFLFDYDRSTLVDDRRPRAENEAKLQIAKSFILDPARVVRADDKFSLVKVF